MWSQDRQERVENWKLGEGDFSSRDPDMEKHIQGHSKLFDVTRELGAHQRETVGTKREGVLILGGKGVKERMAARSSWKFGDRGPGPELMQLSVKSSMPWTVGMERTIFWLLEVEASVCVFPNVLMRVRNFPQRVSLIRNPNSTQLHDSPSSKASGWPRFPKREAERHSAKA